jgi:ATP phosphoribosyltransferase
MLRIDESRCVGCGMCAADCVARHIEVVDGRAREEEGSCIGCGHCMSKCPYELNTPELLRRNLEERGMNCPIVRLDGAVEISVKLGVADAIADVVDSGATLREAGLEIIGEPMLHSEAVVIGRNAAVAELPEVIQLIARLRGIMRAAEYVMVEYDIPRNALEAACKITPGIEAPTIAPLTNADWVAVKSMVKRKECNAVMDELYRIGGRGIIIMEISACRL